MRSRTLLGLLIVWLSLAPALADEKANYFDGVSAELKARGVARPVVLIDLDRLDQNIGVLMSHIQGPLKFRVVEKSLPSLPLLRYILEKTGSNRVMAFHYPYLPLLMAGLPADTSYLFGKTVLIDGVKEFFGQLPPELRSQATRNVQWLIDSEQTLKEYLAYFHEQKQPFAVNVEIDVGLKRGGAETIEQLERILSLIEAHPDEVRFEGFMGYDGHVSHAPAPDIFGLREAAVHSAFKCMEKTYAGFVSDLKAKHPRLYAQATTFNGAGSTTYTLYRPGSPVTDLSVGSGLLKTTDFDEFTLKEHVPAVFVATPVLIRRDSVAIPFLDHFLKFIPDLLDHGNVSFITYGGSWNSPAEYPTGLKDHPLLADGAPPMLPNQGMIYGKPSRKLDVGDFVFFRPHQSDAIFQFEDILLVRGGKVVGSWKPLDRRY